MYGFVFTVSFVVWVFLIVCFWRSRRSILVEIHYWNTSVLFILVSGAEQFAKL